MYSLQVRNTLMYPLELQQLMNNFLKNQIVF